MIQTKSASIVLALIIFGVSSAAHATYPLTCRGWGNDTRSERVLSVESTRTIGHRLLVSILSSVERIPLSRLQPGECSWADRGMRGAELDTKLYVNLSSDMTLQIIEQGNGRSYFSASSPRPSTSQQNRAARLFNDLVRLSRLTGHYTACVEMEVIGSPQVRVPPRNRAVLKV